MTTLFSRLLDICRDQGIAEPKGVDVQRMTGLSSGRITQIKQEGEAAILGERALRRTVKLGYNPDWVQTGRGQKKGQEARYSTTQECAEPGLQWTTARERRISEINDLLRKTDDFGVVAILEKAKEISAAYPAHKQKMAK